MQLVRLVQSTPRSCGHGKHVPTDIYFEKMWSAIPNRPRQLICNSPKGFALFLSRGIVIEFIIEFIAVRMFHITVPIGLCVL